MKIKVYAGLSLDAAAAQALLPGCQVAPPAARGDILADARAGVNVVALVDGRFQQALAVSIGEIGDALRAGVRVYGAASMGALRAAELRDEGMIGAGAIYRWIIEEPCFRDDELGQLFSEGGPERRASVPYANLRFGLLGLEQAGELDAGERRRLDDAYRALFFADRHALGYERALAGADERLLGLARRALAHDQKRLDALELLGHIKADLARIEACNARLLANLRATRSFEIFEPSQQLHVEVLLGS